MEQYKFDLNAKKKHSVIQDYLQKIMNENPQYYYSSSADVARVIHGMVTNDLSRMPIEEQLMFKEMTHKDIEVILSYSSCC